MKHAVLNSFKIRRISMPTKAWFLWLLVLSLLSLQPALGAQDEEAAVEHLGVGKVSIETRQVGSDLVIDLSTDLKEVIALAVSTPRSVEDLVRVTATSDAAQTLAGRLASRSAKAAIHVSTPTLEGGYKVRIEHDLSAARQLDVVIYLSDGTVAPLHFKGSVTNVKLGVALNGTNCKSYSLSCGPPRACTVNQTCCGVGEPCFDCRNCTISCPPCSLVAP
jgi:hypothetical protein